MRASWVLSLLMAAACALTWGQPLWLAAPLVAVLATLVLPPAARPLRARAAPMLVLLAAFGTALLLAQLVSDGGLA